MALSPALLAIVVDPIDHQGLWYFAEEGSLYNPRDRRQYSVTPEGIPVLLVEDSVLVDDDEHTRLCGKADAEHMTLTGGAND
jgi:uncharacterized protein YbaR (Trm112 family)